MMAKSTPMQILTDAQLADLVSRSSLLEGEINKPKVLLDANTYIHKFLYQIIEGLDYRKHLKQPNHSDISVIVDIMAKLHCFEQLNAFKHTRNLAHLMNYLSGKAYTQHKGVKL